MMCIDQSAGSADIFERAQPDWLISAHPAGAVVHVCIQPVVLSSGSMANTVLALLVFRWHLLWHYRHGGLRCCAHHRHLQFVPPEVHGAASAYPCGTYVPLSLYVCCVM
jgi:hypothetical protein